VSVAVCGFAALAAIWLPPGVATRQKLMRSALCVGAAAAALVLVSQFKTSIDVTEDRRNSFAVADANQLAKLAEPLTITVHLAVEDPRYIDLQRNVLGKLDRVMPHVSTRLATARQSIASSTGDEAYGEIEYRYGARTDTTRSTSPREVLPLIYGLAGVEPPAPIRSAEFPGYPLVANGAFSLLWFLAVLPVLIVLAWWRSRRLPSNNRTFLKGGRHEERHENAVDGSRERRCPASAGNCGAGLQGGSLRRNHRRRTQVTGSGGRHLADRD
jgi:hypothetical protein